VVICVALTLTTYQSQQTNLLETSLAADSPPVTKLSTVTGKTVLSSSLWQEVFLKEPFFLYTLSN
jgi:hypothetical protein